MGALNALLATAIIAFAGSVQCFASDLDKTKILKTLSIKMTRHYVKDLQSFAVKPKIFIGGVTNDSKSMTQGDIDYLVDRFEEDLSKLTAVLERKNLEAITKELNLQHRGEVKDSDVQALGQKIGANFIILIKISDRVSPRSEDEDEVMVSARVSMINIESARKFINTSDITFLHEEYSDSNFVGPALTMTLLGTTIAAGVASASYATRSLDAKSKYDKSDNAVDAKKYKEEANKQASLQTTYGAVSVLSAGLTYLSYRYGFMLSRGKRYHEYELIASPTGHYGLGVTWNLN